MLFIDGEKGKRGVAFEVRCKTSRREDADDLRGSSVKRRGRVRDEIKDVQNGLKRSGSGEPRTKQRPASEDVNAREVRKDVMKQRSKPVTERREVNSNNSEEFKDCLPSS